MAEKEDKYDAFHKKVQGHHTTISRYLAEVRDIQNQAIADANKAINYEFHRMDEDEVRKKYQVAVVSRLDDVKKKLKIGSGNKDLDEALLESLGVISEREI